MCDTFQVSWAESPMWRPQGGLLALGIGSGWSPGSVEVMTPGAGLPGSPCCRVPFVSLGVLTQEEILWRSQERLELWRKFEGVWSPLCVMGSGFIVLFCFPGQTLILLYLVYDRIYSATTVLQTLC